jgi:signal transduction histidine kinase
VERVQPSTIATADPIAALLAVLSDAVVLLDPGERVLSWNAPAERLYGVSAAAAAGRPLHEVVDVRREADRCRHATAEGRVVAVERASVPLGDGRRLLVVGPADDAKAPRDLGPAEDTRSTEQTSANAELEALGHSVSHELRSPLATISAGVELLLLDRALPGGAREVLMRTRDGVARMTGVLDALARLARAARAPLVAEPVDLTGLARGIVDDFRAAEPERRVDFVASEGLRTQADPKLLRAMLGEVLGNAWKFTRGRDPAHIELTVATTARETVFCVRDDGSGLAAEHAASMFEPVRDLGHGRRTKTARIGLTIASRVVRRHGGRIWIEGAPGRGAALFFSLPRG